MNQPSPPSTPVETFTVRGRTVFVKRDDLFGAFPEPPLGKARGLAILLREYEAQGVQVVGCWDTRVSKLGQALAAQVRSFPGMRAIVSYPIKAGAPVPEAIKIAASLGAEILPLRGNHVSICYAQAKRYVTAQGGTMLPFGLECAAAVRAIASEAAAVPRENVQGGTLVLSCGSGVTLAGLLLGLPVLPSRIVGLSSGRSIAKIRACVQRYVPRIPAVVEILPAVLPYDHASDYPCPFTSHPNYDRKAWQLLVERLTDLPAPHFFWNVGA